MFGNIPNLTYFVKVIYSSENLVESIKLISVPNGQLHEIFMDATILRAGRITGNGFVRPNIRFKEAAITNIEPWRVKEIFRRR